jgi:hypothetical protein
VPFEAPPQWLLDIIARYDLTSSYATLSSKHSERMCAYRATNVRAGEDGVSHDSRLKIRASVVTELYETFNDCRRASQGEGRHAKPLNMKVAPDFFIAEQHMNWHSAFTTARALLEENFFHAHPMLMKVNELMHATCSSLSFFRHMEDEAFPIDQELFSQIQQCKSGSLVRIPHVESQYLCCSCLRTRQQSSSNPICGRGRTVAIGGPSA